MTGNEKINSLDKVLSQFNLFSCYHGVHMFWTILCLAFNNMYCPNFVFITAKTTYRCGDEEFSNITCKSSNATVQCTEWIYDNPDSFVAEFGLACQEWKRTLVGTVHSLGYMVGLLFMGPMSDRLGRKLMIVISGVLGGVIGLARSFTTWYWLYIALEFLEGAIGDNCSPAFILTVEIVSTKNRLLYYLLCAFGYPLGGVLLPLAAWRFPYWRTLLRVLYTPGLIFFVYLYVIDESPRWLLSKGKKQEAMKIIENAAKKNKINVDMDTLEKIEHVKEKGVNFLELLKITFSSKIIFKRFLVCVVWWTTSTFVNFGLSINSVSLQGNEYVNYALTCLMDVPANIIIMFSTNYCKRKMPLIASFMTVAVLCGVQPFLPANLSALSLVLYMVGKLVSSIYFTITYMYTSELFPTYTRNSMHAMCSSLGRIGSIIAPQTPLLLLYWYALPSLVFGGVSLLAGLITFLVPDTADEALPDTVHQAEGLGESKEKPDGLKTPTPQFAMSRQAWDSSRL